MDKEVLEALLDKLEEGTFCDCLVTNTQEVRLLNEKSHYVNCIGNLKVSEVLYEVQSTKWIE